MGNGSISIQLGPRSMDPAQCGPDISLRLSLPLFTWPWSSKPAQEGFSSRRFLLLASKELLWPLNYSTGNPNLALSPRGCLGKTGARQGFSCEDRGVFHTRVAKGTEGLWLTQRRPRSQHTASSWSHPAARWSAGSHGSSPQVAARLPTGRGRMRPWPKICPRDPPRAPMDPLRRGPGTSSLPPHRVPLTGVTIKTCWDTTLGFAFGSVSTCKIPSGSQKLKANTSEEPQAATSTPAAQRKWSGRKMPKISLVLNSPDCIEHPNFVAAREARPWIMSSSKSKLLNPQGSCVFRARRDPPGRTNLWSVLPPWPPSFTAAQERHFVRRPWAAGAEPSRGFVLLVCARQGGMSQGRGIVV